MTTLAFFSVTAMVFGRLRSYNPPFLFPSFQGGVGKFYAKKIPFSTTDVGTLEYDADTKTFHATSVDWEEVQRENETDFIAWLGFEPYEIGWGTHVMNEDYTAPTGEFGLSVQCELKHQMGPRRTYTLKNGHTVKVTFYWIGPVVPRVTSTYISGSMKEDMDLSHRLWEIEHELYTGTRDEILEGFAAQEPGLARLEKEIQESSCRTREGLLDRVRRLREWKDEVA